MRGRTLEQRSISTHRGRVKLANAIARQRAKLTDDDMRVYTALMLGASIVSDEQIIRGVRRNKYVLNEDEDVTPQAKRLLAAYMVIPSNAYWTPEMRELVKRKLENIRKRKQP